MRVTSRSRPANRDDDGIALVMVVVIMLVVTILMSVVFSVGIQQLPLARRSQDYQAALQAAEAGIQDYVNRLDNNPTYYQSSDASNAALPTNTNPNTWSSWAPVSGGGSNEWYRYAVNSSTVAQTGTISLAVTGAAGQYPSGNNSYAMRTIEVNLQRAGFTNFLYFTNYEIEDPNLVNGVSNYQSACVVHAWEYNSYDNGFGPDPSICDNYLIYFASADVLNGKVFSNDEFNICAGATFTQDVESAYDQGPTEDPSKSPGGTDFGAAGSYNQGSCGGSPNFEAGGTEPEGAGYEQFPATNTDMEADIPTTNDGGGCLFYGPWTLVFSNGQMQSYPTPGSTGSSASAPTGASYACESTYNSQNKTWSSIPIPPNGLLYDANETSCGNSCGSSTYADVSVQGTVGSSSTSEQVTVGSQYDINITDNLVDYSQNGSFGTNMIGLSAAEAIEIPAMGPNTNLTVDAAMVALNDSIYLPGWSNAAKQGTFTVNGSMAQDYRGPIGTFNSSTGVIETGYAKSYNYDPRLEYEQPPYFTSPENPDWTPGNITECAATPTPVAPTPGASAKSC